VTTNPDLFGLMNRVTDELRRKGSVTLEELTLLAREEHRERLLNQALRFLAERDEILLDVELQAIHWRRRVTRHIAEVLDSSHPLSIQEIADRTPYGFATCSDALGWMEREGRVRLLPDDRFEASPYRSPR